MDLSEAASGFQGMLRKVIPEHVRIDEAGRHVTLQSRSGAGAVVTLWFPLTGA